MFLEIMGISAHAGRCYQDGASAILELAHKILAFDAYVDLDHNTTVNTGACQRRNVCELGRSQCFRTHPYYVQDA